MSGTDPQQPGMPIDGPPDTVDVPLPDLRPLPRLDYHAVSDVGRVRKDNQDSGYAGPWLLAVCDGVGGAARGDIASGTAIGELRRLDQAPGSVDLVERVDDALHQAHLAIGAQVDQDPALSGTSTTATVGVFDGSRLAIGHVGDSRAYLLRRGELSQLTADHTFVQSLIDEGRITEAEARVHPHRNLILKALDGQHEVEPDLFALEVAVGDRLFFCSDGACGVLDDARLTSILSGGTPEFAAIELVRASLEAGSSDNVTCVVADVVPAEGTATPEPLVVGAAADLRQRRARTLFRGHRSGDTGELEPVDAEIPAGMEYAIRADPPVDPETLRYMPQAPPRFRWARRLLALAVIVGIAWIGLGTAYWWTQRQFYIGEQDGYVVIFRGVDVPGLSSVYKVSDLRLDDLRDTDQELVRDGAYDYNSYRPAADMVAELGERAADDATGTPADGTTTPTDPAVTDDASPLTPTSPTTTTPATPDGAAG